MGSLALLRGISNIVARLAMRPESGGHPTHPTVSVGALHMPQILTAFVGFQFQGSNSSSRLIGCPSTMRWSTSCRYA
jgi:hypothetical protein